MATTKRGTGKADGVQVEVWGWSDSSEADAANLAISRAQRVAESIARGERGKGYLYGTNPLREPVLDQLDFGVVSRNGYGCEVLNTQSVLFCDIDLDDKPSAPTGVLSQLFGRKAAPSTVPPARWPFRDQQQERAFEAWRVRYEAASAGNAVCARLEHLGSTRVNPEVQAALNFHDRKTKTDSGLPLA